jgi:hypothetical protein
LDKSFCRGSGPEWRRAVGFPALAHTIADLASAPIENFVTEFLPDVVRRIHLRVVLFQRILNQVARTPGTGSP